VHYREESAVNEWKQDTEKDQRNGEFLFSSVMAIYNMEDYLREAVDSILQQTIGFEENIQLILVDDGSTDGSSAICDEYAKEYPNNIIAIHKENGGVSSARNEGKKKATGRYVNFPDPDDYFDLDAYERVGVFFEEHYNETDVVCIPIVMFGEKEGEYWQNYKFRKGKRIIDLRKEWEVSCMNSTCSFIKNVKAIDVDFDEELVMSEDTKYLTEILCDKMTLGVVGNCRYWYRIRDNSTIRKAKEDRRTYFPIQNRLQQYIIKKCVEELGYVPQYVQNILMMDIGWKIRAVEYPEEAMSKEDTKQYLKYMLSLVETFDDEVILRQRNIYWEHKYFLFKRKYGEDLKLEPVYLDINYLLYGQVLRKMSQLRMVVENLCIEKDELYVSGYIPLIGIDDNANVQVAYAIDDKVYLMKNREPTEGVKEIIESVCGKLCKRYFFDGRIPVFDEYFGKNIVFYLLVDNHPVWMKNIGFGERAPFSGKWKNEYYISDEYFVKQRSDSLKIGLLEKESDIKKLEDDFKKEIRDTLKKKSKNPMFENSPEKQQLEELLNLASG
ncbi:MAG: glycosyltransferase family 2 protein, partial [Lachnospiraceae bacterium]|nr:glycosyltransferase family 2 protein [Lachnospiraceae bacterium]